MARLGWVLIWAGFGRASGMGGRVGGPKRQGFPFWVSIGESKPDLSAWWLGDVYPYSAIVEAGTL